MSPCTGARKEPRTAVVITVKFDGGVDGSWCGIIELVVAVDVHVILRGLMAVVVIIGCGIGVHVDIRVGLRIARGGEESRLRAVVMRVV